MMTSQQPTHAEYSHDRLGDAFADALSTYDTTARVEVLVDRFLPAERLSNKRVLDVGCGLGFFSQRLQERGADVTACDIGPSLVEATRRRAGCRAQVVDALQLANAFGESSFDVVVSSECIEHTRAPSEALRQMALVLKPRGYLSVSTPNIVWQPVVRAATHLRLRPFDGNEFFSSWRSLRRNLNVNGIEVLDEYGLHLFPFQLPAHGLSRWCDVHLQCLRTWMINICMLGRKRELTP